jgi:hypothetical protein
MKISFALAFALVTSCALAISAAPTAMAATPKKPTPAAAPGLAPIALSCKGYDSLMSRNSTFIFRIDPNNRTFVGTIDNISEISGSAIIDESRIILSYKQSEPKSDYKVWIDRNVGEFKVDIVASGLFLPGNTVGRCEKFTGRAF